MKTSTKIFMGVAAAAVALCVVNAVIAWGQFKLYDAEARRVLAEMDAAPVTTLDVTVLQYVPQEWHETRGGSGSTKQRLGVTGPMLVNVRVANGTMYIKDYDQLVGEWLLVSPSLDKVILRKPGEPDRVIDIEEEEAGEAAEPEGH
jgi:hypothetical protein